MKVKISWFWNKKSVRISQDIVHSRQLQSKMKALEKSTSISLLPISTFLHMRMCLKDRSFSSAVGRKVRNFIGCFNMSWINYHICSRLRKNAELSEPQCSGRSNLILIKGPITRIGRRHSSLFWVSVLNCGIGTQTPCCYVMHNMHQGSYQL